MKPEILEYDTHRIILYRNIEEFSQRALVLDLDNNIIQDEIVEYDRQGKLVANVVFAPDHLTVVGMRKYINENDTEDYRLINDKLVLVSAMKHHKIDKDTVRIDTFNGQGELLYYDIYARDPDPEIDMNWQERYLPDGKVFDYDAPNEKVKNLQRYSDY